jgi:hypothetical protein
MGILGFTDNRCSVNFISTANGGSDVGPWAEDQGKNFSFVKFKSFLSVSTDPTYPANLRELEKVVIESNTFTSVNPGRTIDLAVRCQAAAGGFGGIEAQPDFIRIEKNMHLNVNNPVLSRPRMQIDTTGNAAPGALTMNFDFSALLPLGAKVEKVLSVTQIGAIDDAGAATFDQPRVQIVSSNTTVRLTWTANRRAKCVVQVDCSDGDI